MANQNDIEPLPQARQTGNGTEQKIPDTRNKTTSASRSDSEDGVGSDGNNETKAPPQPRNEASTRGQ